VHVSAQRDGNKPGGNANHQRYDREPVRIDDVRQAGSLALPRGPEPPQQAEIATGVISPAQLVGDL
jgi:hypothetical protein